MEVDGSTEPVQRGSNYFKNQAKKRKPYRLLQNLKVNGRKGNFGRGTELDEQQYHFLVSILEAMSKQEDTEQRQLMANNVFGQYEGKEIRSTSNQLGCRVFENLLPFVDEETFAKLMDTFAENFRVVCCDKYAAHVMQRMLYVALLRGVAPLQNKEDGADQATAPPESKPQGNEVKRANGPREWPFEEYSMKEPYSDEHRSLCRKFVKRLAKFILNNLEEFVWDCTANYVVRQCILNLSGIKMVKMANSTGGKGHQVTTVEPKLIVPEKWQKLLIEFNSRLMAWPQFADLPYNELTSVVLQTLLRALCTIEDQFLLEQLLSKLHDEAFLVANNFAKQEEVEDTKNLNEDKTLATEWLEIPPKALKQAASMRLLESCITVGSSSFLKERVFEGLFRGNLKAMSLSKMHNFAVQRFIEHTNDKDVIEIVFAELEESLESVLRVGHTGIALALAKACARLAIQQGKFVKLLLDALHCGEVAPEKMINAVLCLLPADVKTEPTPQINLHGSLILQAMLEFNKPIKFVSGLLEMPSIRLADILSNPRGSFIANAFFGSRFVGEKSREKMVRHLEGQYSQLVLTSHGSRVVEIMYNAGNPAQRESIVSELADRCTQLNNTPWGIIINKRLLVDTYRSNPKRWKVAINMDAKVEKMFDKLVSGVKRKATNSE